MQIDYVKSFLKSYKKLDRKIQNKFDEKVVFFQKDPFDKSLRNHSLVGEYSGFRSIDITGNYRAIFREYPDGTYEFVDFIDIGTHSQLY